MVDHASNDAVLALLRSPDFEIEGRMPYSSNGTFLVTYQDEEPQNSPPEDDAEAPAKSSAETTASDGEDSLYDEDGLYDEDEEDDGEDGNDEERTVDVSDGRLRGIYKPLRTERPLWDFPEGLYKREVATFELNRWLGWDVIPPTALCEGPLGIGSVQRFIEADFSKHYFDHLEDEDLHPQLRRLCALDLLTNQTDRKGGHCLIDGDDHIWGIDNGLSFHEEFKVRTVIWDFAGEPIDDDLIADLERLIDHGVPETVAELVPDKYEQAAMLDRAETLVAGRTFPYDHSGRRYPWPMI